MVRVVFSTKREGCQGDGRDKKGVEFGLYFNILSAVVLTKISTENWWELLETVTTTLLPYALLQYVWAGVYLIS